MSSTRQYRCKMGGHTLIKGVWVEDTIFTVEFACDYEKCKGACCYAEVEDVELEGGSLTPLEASAIRKYKGTLARYCDPSRKEQVLNKPVYSSCGDWYVSLNENKECVLLNMKKGTCACKLAHKREQFPFAIPLACQLYPLSIYTRSDGERVLELLNTFEEICNCGYEKGEREHIPVYEFLKEPLIRAFGEDFYKDVETHAKEWNN